MIGSMRILFAVLLLLNLALWGWIRFIDLPARPAPPVEKAAVPTLHLASEPDALAVAAARCVSIGPFTANEPLEMWRTALATGAYVIRERVPGEPAQTWIDIDLTAGQPPFAAALLPGSPSMEGLRQELCATRAVPELPAGATPSPTPPAVTAPAASPAVAGGL